MAKQDLPRPRPRNERPEVRRATSVRIAERIFDNLILVCFAVLGLLLIGLAVMLHSTIAVAGGVVVLVGMVPLWLAKFRTDRKRSTRGSALYALAALAVIVGLILWVHPWN
jgi:hypothetical protein